MTKKCALLITFFIVSITSTFAQEIIPFRMNGHYNIIVKALLNNRDSADLMFQIAMREGSLAPTRKRKMESVIFDTSEFKEGLSKINRIRIADTELDSIWIWDNEYTGYEAEGKIGTQLFKNKIFSINYDKSFFQLHEKLPDTTGFIGLPLHSKNGRLFLNLSSNFGDENISHEVMLQSGFSGTIFYNNQLADTNDLPLKLVIMKETEVKNSAGDKLKSLICILPTLDIAGVSFSEIPVNLFEGAIKNQSITYMGADLIHRFNWIFDIKGGKAYLQKNNHFNDIFYFNRS